MPSEASYSRMITIISETDAMTKVQDVLIAQAIQEGYITEESLAIDATNQNNLRKKRNQTLKKNAVVSLKRAC